jgi:hypothetical protein
VGIKGKGLNIANINHRYARRRRRVILFRADPGQWLTNITNLSGRCDFVVTGSAVGAKITATKHNFVPGQKTVTGP